MTYTQRKMAYIRENYKVHNEYDLTSDLLIDGLIESDDLKDAILYNELYFKRDVNVNDINQALKDKK